jgi:hypothetical protein
MGLKGLECWEGGDGGEGWERWGRTGIGGKWCVCALFVFIELKHAERAMRES